MTPFYEIQEDKLKIINNKRELTYAPHIHENIEILYVYSGTQHLSINNIDYEINEGDVAIILPNILHEYYKADKKIADGLLIICDPQIFLNMFPNLMNSIPENPVVRKENLNQELIFAINSITPEKPLPIKLGFTYVVMSHILSMIKLQKNTTGYSDNMTQKIIEYIQENFKNPITLDVMAKDLCVSKYYISHIFSERLKINFRNYIGKIRVEYATKLIRTTNLTLTDISNESGFESQRTFNRIFHLIYGMSPRDYKYYASEKNNPHK